MDQIEAIRVIVNGAKGKMGLAACETINAHQDFTLVAALSREDDLRAEIIKHRAQIVIDLTRADCVFDNSMAILESGAYAVIGTSGLTDTQLDQLDHLCHEKSLGAIVAPNFSISAVLMMRFAAEAARFLPEVEIIEMHHQQKYDAPSGTALKTAEMIGLQRCEITQKQPASHETISGVRGGRYQNIAIHSLRLPGVVARQDVIFGNVGETLTISHNSIDRKSFMPGVVLCCQKVMSLQKLCYGLETILDF